MTRYLIESRACIFVKGYGILPSAKIIDKDLDIVMSMYDLMEYSNSYSKTLETLCQYCRDEPNAFITYSESFKFNVKYLSNFRKTFEMT